ncbi:MAG: hypothetical protein CVT49_09110 [candidate division Zixibacteria bacterium HGW-Zixibacteria-1]|nr:MAG: hypothetical protein CVT49_09110 [candidate division Zixibacteria bacterium HGW-Zixibacteria-1]
MSGELKEKVLVTGANGFVGSRLCRRLLADGFHVIAGVREGCDGTYLVPLDVEYRFGDITQPETLPEMVAGVDYIIHNAGVVKVTRQEMFFEVNQAGTRNLLEAAAATANLKKLIFISSAAASGPSEPGLPRTEAMPPMPITAYGRSKMAAEEEVLKFADKINSVIIRPPAIYGPGDKEMFAFFNILNNRIKPYLGSLKRRIQLVHVDDLARAVSIALRARTSSGAIYFIGEKQSYSYKELVRHLRNAVGRAGLPLYIPGGFVKAIAFLSESVMKIFGKTPMFTVEKADEILGNWEFCVGKAGDELGFESEIAFADGALETTYWYREEGWL